MIPELAERVKDAVSTVESEMSVKQIAKACGVSVQSVYKWRRGETTHLKGETLVELAEISGFNARWIINGKGPRLGPQKDARTILDALPLISDDMRDSWLEAARKALEKSAAKTNTA